MKDEAGRVVIGPHERSVTIDVMDADERVLGGGRFATDVAGFRSMLDSWRRWLDRVWAIEECTASAATSRCGCSWRAKGSSTCRRSRTFELGRDGGGMRGRGPSLHTARSRACATRRD
jgi:hypothetical protein